MDKICYCMMIILFVILYRKIKWDIRMRKNFKSIQKHIDEFNYVFEQCKEYLQFNIAFCNIEDDRVLQKMNEKGEFEVDLSLDYYFVVKDTGRVRQFLLNSGKEILEREEFLKRIYGEIKYNHTYQKFRENYTEVRRIACSLGEKI